MTLLGSRPFRHAVPWGLCVRIWQSLHHGRLAAQTPRKSPRSHRVSRGAVFAALPAIGLLVVTGCSQQVVNETLLEEELEAAVERAIAVRASSIDCEGSIPVEAREVTECVIRFPGAGTSVAEIRIRQPVGSSPDGDPEPVIVIRRFLANPDE